MNSAKPELTDFTDEISPEVDLTWFTEEDIYSLDKDLHDLYHETPFHVLRTHYGFEIKDQLEADLKAAARLPQ